MGNQCSCLTSLPQTSTENLTRANNIPVIKAEKTKQNQPTVNTPLISEAFSSFVTTPKGIELSMNKSNLLPIKIHKYLMRLLTKKHFEKRRDKFEKEADKIYRICEKTIYGSSNLVKAELSNKLEKYDKNGYTSIYPDIKDKKTAEENELIYSPPSNEYFSNVIYIQYEEKKTIPMLKEDEEFDISSNFTSLTKTFNQGSPENAIYDRINNYALSIYKGDINIDNQPNGYGIKITRQGEKYIGYWKNGSFTGWNCLIDKKGDVYMGKFKDGALTGKGSQYTMSTGAIYKGSFINSLKNGEGEEKSNEGTYIGSWKEGAKHGQGKMEYSSGDVYEGEFSNDLYNGNGYYKWKISGYEYKGEYKNGVMHGKGIYKWNKNEYYKGTFVNGIKEGNGEIKWSNGRKYIGPVKDGKPHGIGIYDNGMNFRGEVEFIEGRLNKNYSKNRNDANNEKKVVST